MTAAGEAEHVDSSDLGAILDEFQEQLDALRERRRGRPWRELEDLLLIALEREQLVSVAYRHDLMWRRLAELGLDPTVRGIAGQALAWAWKDEQMHAIYTRGVLLSFGGFAVRSRARFQQLGGAIAGWASSVRQHLGWRQAPVSSGIAAIVTHLGKLIGKVPRALRRELELLSFARFCELQVDAERTASACWERVAELGAAVDRLEPEAQAEFRRMWDDEQRHGEVFAILARSLAIDQPSPDAEVLSDQIRAVGEFFVPREFRTGALGDNPLGSGGRVWSVEGRPRDDKRGLFHDLLERSGLAALVRDRATACGRPVSSLRVVIKPTFMFGYDRRDPSVFTDPELIDELAGYLRELGCSDVVVAEGSMIYSRFFRNRSVREVAEYLGIASPHFRLVDMDEDQVDHQYARGMAQYRLSRTWRDADLRISFGKMRSHPVDLTHLSIPGLQGIAAGFENSLFPERQAHRDTALLAPLSEFPPHYALIDGYDAAADGLIGILACPRHPRPRRLYAGADALAVDMVATRHLGVRDPRRSMILDSACHWFGDPTRQTEVIGIDVPVPGWRSPVGNGYTALLSSLAWPMWQWGSRRGALFVPWMDPVAFPPLRAENWGLRFRRAVIRRLVGMDGPR